jgi:hypothetical protein
MGLGRRDLRGMRAIASRPGCGRSQNETTKYTRFISSY